MKIIGLIVTLIFISNLSGLDNLLKKSDLRVPKIDYEPRTYICLHTTEKINIDGKGSEKVWINAQWTDLFVDIEGDLKPKPEFDTKVKMLWDDNFMYFYAEMVEPHLWATLTERDAVIYHDNDFEIFIDPDGDTHNYYELEFNLFGTLWDLLLTKPYRDGGHAIDAWDVRDIKYALNLDGTLNDPSDIDKGWSIEVAIPWNVLEEAAGHGGPPVNGEYWKVNFSRVQWDTEIIDGKYIKKNDPEHNWVWSPQGLIAMHFPEMWGIVDFRIENLKRHATFKLYENEKWILRQLYYGMKYYKDKNKVYPQNLTELYSFMGIGELEVIPELKLTQSMFEITLSSEENTKWHINNNGKLWMGK
ncbi:MAG: carbohydrate-binding family 9-like protein [Candidatus Delongbacteria bacterium]|nr:carbohydrate-binding family 9-like protein [Candidatus Delongbacteria bacterium]